MSSKREFHCTIVDHASKGRARTLLFLTGTIVRWYAVSDIATVSTDHIKFVRISLVFALMTGAQSCAAVLEDQLH